jgi:hypothetical protein
METEEEKRRSSSKAVVTAFLLASLVLGAPILFLLVLVQRAC